MIRVPKEKVMREEAFDFICDAEVDLRYAIRPVTIQRQLPIIQKNKL